jgi:hypothetical protein
MTLIRLISEISINVYIVDRTVASRTADITLQVSFSSQSHLLRHRTYALYKFTILCINENTSFQAFLNHPLINSDRLKSVEKSS